jgi:hypothetical protein
VAASAWHPAVMSADETSTTQQVQSTDGVDDWRALAIGASAWFAAPSQSAGADLVRRIAVLAGTAQRMPDVDLRATGVHVRTADPTLAHAISSAAVELGLVADPAAVQSVQLVVDVLDTSAVIPFWQAALDYVPLGAADLVDPLRRDPAFSFEELDVPRPLRNRIHVDVSRPHALILDGLATAKTVGGRETYVGEYYATVADAEGNEADFVALVPIDEIDGGEATADWRSLFGVMTFYPVTSPTRAADLATEVAALADDAGMPLLVDLRPDGVTIDTGKDQGDDERFDGLARRVQAAARGMGLRADPSRLRFVQIGIDAVDIPAVRGFWRSVLGYEYDLREGVTDIYDPRRLNLPIIFQQMSASEEDRRRQRNRIHVDVAVPHDQARVRVDRALAAGGRILKDDEAPHRWTLADPERNELDIVVTVGHATQPLGEARNGDDE